MTETIAPCASYTLNLVGNMIASAEIHLLWMMLILLGAAVLWILKGPRIFRNFHRRAQVGLVLLTAACYGLGKTTSLDSLTTLSSHLYLSCERGKDLVSHGDAGATTLKSFMAQQTADQQRTEYLAGTQLFRSFLLLLLGGIGAGWFGGAVVGWSEHEDRLSEAGRRWPWSSWSETFKRKHDAANALARQAHYARLNWTFHAIPMIHRGFSEFEAEVSASSNCSGSAVLSMLKQKEPFSELLNDFVIIRMRDCPVSLTSIVGNGEGSSSLVEQGAMLMFAPLSTGAVAALLSAPYSDLCAAEKDVYLVEVIADPRLLTREKVRGIFKRLMNLQLFCRAVLPMSDRAKKLLKALEMDDRTASGRVYAKQGLSLKDWFRTARDAPTTGQS